MLIVSAHTTDHERRMDITICKLLQTLQDEATVYNFANLKNQPITLTHCFHDTYAHAHVHDDL